MKNKLRLGFQRGEFVACRKIDAELLKEEFGENYGRTRQVDYDGEYFTDHYFLLEDLQEIMDVFKNVEIESC